MITTSLWTTAEEMAQEIREHERLNDGFPIHAYCIRMRFFANEPWFKLFVCPTGELMEMAPRYSEEFRNSMSRYREVVLFNARTGEVKQEYRSYYGEMTDI